MRLATDWNLPIGWPNCLRLRTCSMQRSSWRRIVRRQVARIQARSQAIEQLDLGHQRCAQPHLIFLFSDAKSLCAFLDDQRADTCGAELRIKGRVDREQICDRSIRYKNFPAVQNVVTCHLSRHGSASKKYPTLRLARWFRWRRSDFRRTTRAGIFSFALPCRISVAGSN